jgi:hypothetical protein
MSAEEIRIVIEAGAAKGADGAEEPAGARGASAGS